MKAVDLAPAHSANASIMSASKTTRFPLEFAEHLDDHLNINLFYSKIANLNCLLNSLPTSSMVKLTQHDEETEIDEEENFEEEEMEEEKEE